MKPFTSQEVAKWLNLPSPSSQIQFTSVTTDSRKVTAGCLFIAIKGENHDGHNYILKAIELGAASVISEIAFSEAELKGSLLFQVSDTLTAFRSLSFHYHSQFQIPKIAVIGSVGKTTTKEFLSSLLKGRFQKVLKTEGSQNGFLGIPITLMGMNETTEVAVIEIGIDDLGAMNQHMELVRPTHVILTQTGPEHLHQLKNEETAASEELLGLEWAWKNGASLFANLNDFWTTQWWDRNFSDISTKNAFSFQLLPGHQDPNTPQNLIHPEVGVIPCPLPGEHQLSNLLGAITVVRSLGFSRDEILKGLETFKTAFGRSEIYELDHNTTLIGDHYNSNPTSLRASIQTAVTLSLQKNSKLHLVLGDMLELGENEEAYHRALSNMIETSGIDCVFLFGPRMKWLMEECATRSSVSHYESLVDLTEDLLHQDLENTVILFKGSRGMRLENVLNEVLARLKFRVFQPHEIQSVIDLLKQNQVVALPTETVYGLAGNAFQESAVEKIFRAKNRPSHDPLIAHIKREYLNNEHPLKALVEAGVLSSETLGHLQEAIEKIMKRFWPGPLTFVLPKGEKISHSITANEPTVAIRIPNHPLFLEVLSQVSFPLVAPSANQFGHISPTTSEHVVKELHGRIAGVLEGGACQVGIESTILKVNFEDSTFTVLRPGKISSKEISDVSGLIERRKSQSDSSTLAPGQLESHYAPRKACVWITDETLLAEASKDPSLSILSEVDFKAESFYAKLRELDEDLSVEKIGLFFKPEKDPYQNPLRFALQDRIQRACGSKI